MSESQGAFTAATGRGLEDDGNKPRYLRYQYELIEPHCGASVLEVGSGLGEFSAHFTGRERVVVTDVDDDTVRQMTERFADRPEIEVAAMDLDGEPHLDEPVDSVVAINVLEHFEDDVAVLAKLSRLVVPGGTIVLWVPGYQRLYGDFDRKVGHYRRYTPESLARAARGADLTVERSRPVNLLGALAWWLAVRRGGAGAPNPRLVRVYDTAVVPVTRAMERLVPVPFGQSVLCVARTPR